MDESWTTIDGPDDLRLGEVMPAWFAGRMLADEWKFGLLLSTGQTMLISRIEAVHLSPAGQVLLDVEMLLAAEAEGVAVPEPVLLARTGRPRATVNLAHVVAAFEVAGAPGEDEDGED